MVFSICFSFYRNLASPLNWLQFFLIGLIAKTFATINHPTAFYLYWWKIVTSSIFNEIFSWKILLLLLYCRISPLIVSSYSICPRNNLLLALSNKWMLAKDLFVINFFEKRFKVWWNTLWISNRIIYNVLN